jgi:alkaline phosphatase D
LLEDDPNDLESLFNLAVAQAQLNQASKAMETVGEALDRGLPFERFQVGPRKELKPLQQISEFKKLEEKHGKALLHGPMIGRVTESGVQVWVRTAEEATVQIILGKTKESIGKIKSDPIKSQQSEDYTAILPISDLEPATLYYYDVLIENKPMLGPQYPSFKTYPSAEGGSELTVGFGGGAGFVPQNEHMWDRIQEKSLDAFLFLGDNVYINMPEMPNGVHYYTYYRRQSRPEFRRLVSTTPVYAIWDDHDAATDDTWLGPYKDKPAWKMPLLGVFKQNWINPGYGSTEWPGCWFKFSIADVDFFLLDGRFYRINPFEEKPTMLGPNQKKWLLEGLVKSTATFKVIASPVPWTFASKGEARDTWNGFREERNEIFDFLIENKIDGVILLSADRHRSDAWRIDYKQSYPLYEFESSRLTNQHSHELMPNALFGYNEKQSFGYLMFNTKAEEPTVTYQIVNIDNEIKGQITVKRSEIVYEK